MAWTAPRTWIAGEIVTAALLNTHLRDQLKALGDSWTAYTPTWQDGPGGTALAIGNGTLSGSYMQFGKYVSFRIQWVRGTTTNLGTAAYIFGLPVAPLTYRINGGADVLQSSSGSSIPHFWNGIGGSTIAVQGTNGNGVRRIGNTGWGLTATGWAVSDELRVTGTYEAL